MMSPTVGSITSWKSALGRTLSVMSISHRIALDGLGLVLAFEHQLLAFEDVQRIGLLLRRLEGDEVGARDVRLARKRQEEGRIVVRRRHDIHAHAPLVARDGRAPRSEDPAVEEVVIVLGGVEHQHPPGLHRQRIGDIQTNVAD